MRTKTTSFTVNVTISDSNYGIIYVSKSIRQLIDPVEYPFYEFQGSDKSPIWYLIPSKNEFLLNNKHQRSTNAMKAKKIVAKMDKYLDMEADINKFNVELVDLNGRLAFKFDVSKNTNIQTVNTSFYELYEPYKLTTKGVKPITFSEYAPVPLSKGYYVEI
jgi:hypothetical protein